MMERLRDAVRFDVPQRSGQTGGIDEAAVDAKLAGMAQDEDL
jgi:ATP-dependent protease HslVU (ClpYQ) ATPase subunit